MVFAKSKKFCQEFLRVILQDKKLIVLENDVQKYLPSAFSKNMVLDMLCRLGDGSIVNVEIQLINEKEHAKRIFTYASKIKSYLIEKGSTVYEVEMNIVSDQKEKIGKWDAGVKVYYINTKGLTNKNINEYLKLLTDKTTISKKYKETSAIKKELFELGGATMSKEMRAILNSERAEGMQQGMLKVLLGMVKEKILSVAEAAKRLGVSEKEFMRLAKA